MDHSIRNGTISGTLLTIATTINTGDIFKTAILAAVGAVVSFIISLVLKKAVKQFNKKI
jgi:mannitol-specific phosphotransferase system IIBC component